jgi:hypothetical protein
MRDEVMTMIPRWLPILVCMPLLLPAACDSGGIGTPDREHFLDPCTEDSECPAQWTCPNPGELYNGTITDVCTPACNLDTECREMLDREDVMCYVAGFCAIECASHDGCPDILPFCRGSDPSCAGEDYRPWCAREDYVCP